MALRLQELCSVLVQDTCGNVCSQIFASLAEHGRSSRIQLQQHTRMPGRQLRSGLTVLVQQHLVLHHTSEDEVTFYQVDWRNAYCLLRSNRIISLTEDRYGETAGKIVANLLQLGHATVGVLAQAFDLSTVAATKRDSGIQSCYEHVNGDAMVNGADMQRADESKIATVAQFHHTLRTLLRAGFLIKLNKRAYVPAADLQYEIEEAVISDQFPDGKVSGPKKQAEFQLAVNSLKRKWQDDNDYSDKRDVESAGSLRRSGVQSNKRTRLNGVLTNGHDSNNEQVDDGNVPKLPNDMVLQVNHAQSVLAFRSQRLEQVADSCLGGVTAYVYGALLQLLEVKIRCRDDNMKVVDDTDDEDEADRFPTATTMEVAGILDPTVDLTQGILGANDDQRLPNGNGKPKKKSKRPDPEFADIGIKQEAQSDDDGDDHSGDGYSSYRDQQKHFALVELHLKLLEEHPKGFCQRVGGGGRGEWRANFSALTETLIQAEIDSTVLARFGKVHTRTLRLLRERGRLDEKQVAAFAMMKMKDVRAVLTELQYAGIVEVQEVPKDAARQPARTVFLWFHDQARVQRVLLQNTYQGMARAFQRLKQERENSKNVIEKAEMMDVKQDALTQNEREALTHWREVEEKLLVQVQRMDEMVALLRDFSGKDKSLVS